MPPSAPALSISSTADCNDEAGADFAEEELMGAKVYLDRALLASKKNGKQKIQRLVESFGRVKDAQIAVIDARIRELRKEAKLNIILDEFNYKENKIKELTEYINKMKKSLLCLGKEVSTQQINAKYKRKCEEEVKKSVGKIDMQNNRIRQLNYENDELKASILSHKHALTMIIHQIEQAEVAKMKRRFSTALSRSRKQNANPGKFIQPPPEVLITPNGDRFELMFRDSSDLLTEKHEQLTEVLAKGKSIDKTLDTLQLELNEKWSDVEDTQRRLQEFIESEEYQVVERLKLAAAHLKNQMAEDSARKKKIEAAILMATPGSFALDSKHGVEVYNALLRRKENREEAARLMKVPQPIAYGNNKIVNVYRDKIVRVPQPHQLEVCDQAFDLFQSLTVGGVGDGNIFGASGGASTKDAVKTELIKRHGNGGSSNDRKNLLDFFAVQNGWTRDDSSTYDDFGYTEALTQIINLIDALTDNSKFDFATIETLKESISDLTKMILRAFGSLNQDKKLSDELEEMKMQALKKQDYIRERFLNAMFGENRKKISNEIAVSIDQIEGVRRRLTKWNQTIERKRESVNSLMRVLNAKRSEEKERKEREQLNIPAPAATSLETILEDRVEEDRVVETDPVDAAVEETKGEARKVYVAPYTRVARSVESSALSAPRNARNYRDATGDEERLLYSPPPQLAHYVRESAFVLPTAQILPPDAAAEQRTMYRSSKLEKWRPRPAARARARARARASEEEEEEEDEEEEDEEGEIVVEDILGSKVLLDHSVATS